MAGGAVEERTILRGNAKHAHPNRIAAAPAGNTGAALTEDDLTATQPHGDVLEWHKILLQLRDHYADPRANPRERFSVGVAQDENDAATGVAVTSARQPLVDSLTVKQTGAIAFALSDLVNNRISAQHEQVMAEVKDTPKPDLDKLPPARHCRARVDGLHRGRDANPPINRHA